MFSITSTSATVSGTCKRMVNSNVFMLPPPSAIVSPTGLVQHHGSVVTLELNINVKTEPRQLIGSDVFDCAELPLLLTGIVSSFHPISNLELRLFNFVLHTLKASLTFGHSNDLSQNLPNRRSQAFVPTPFRYALTRNCNFGFCLFSASIANTFSIGVSLLIRGSVQYRCSTALRKTQ